MPPSDNWSKPDIESVLIYAALRSINYAISILLLRYE